MVIDETFEQKDGAWEYLMSFPKEGTENMYAIGTRFDHEPTEGEKAIARARMVCGIGQAMRRDAGDPMYAVDPTGNGAV